MLPGPPECIGVGMAGDPRHVLIPPHHQGVVRRVHLGCGAVDAGQGEQFTWELRHEHHHGRVRGEPLGAELLPNRHLDFRQVTVGRGCALEVDVCPHIAENPGGLDLWGPGQRLLPLLRAICYPRAAHVSGYSCWSGRA